MSQSESDINAAPVNGAEATSTSTRPPARARRRRTSPARAASRAGALASEAPEQTAAAEMPEPVAQPTEQPQVQAPAEEAAEQRAVRPQRSRRSVERRGASRKTGGVQLVKIAREEEGEQAHPAEPAETPAQAETRQPATEAARTVPVLTEGPTAETTSTAEPAAQPAATAEAPAPRRYRFERRQPSVLLAPIVRPERLSGRLTQVAGQEEEAEASAPQEPQREEAEAPGEMTAAEREHQARELRDIAAELGLLPSRPLPERVEEEEQGPARVIEIPGSHEPEAAEEPVEEAAPDETAPEATTEQPATSRRRRRRRRGATHETSAEEGAPEEAEEQPEELSWAMPLPPEEPEPYAPAMEPYEPEPYARNGHPAGGFATQPYSPYGRQPRKQPEAPWNITSAQQQIGQPESPFESPEPSFARGFGPMPRGAATPARQGYTRGGRPERGTDIPPMSSNQLAHMVQHSIQEQTDRLLTELRQQYQTPSMTVMFPPMPSTERVGVFVDVANLLYSARSMRVSIDFGKLLEFLRGNRRLIRAQAYAPTNPDPNAEQAFLSAVKGVGYRITTKNYKTFASGAKKADMDLDLCMDIVRLVGAGALDTVVLVSGDSDFLPLLEYCSDHGVRVEVAAFEDAAAMILRQSCDLFINLSLVPDVRG